MYFFNLGRHNGVFNAIWHFSLLQRFDDYIGNNRGVFINACFRGVVLGSGLQDSFGLFRIIYIISFSLRGRKLHSQHGPNDIFIKAEQVRLSFREFNAKFVDFFLQKSC